MKRLNLTNTLLLLLILAGVAWAAGTVTDYITLTPAAAPGAADEGTIYYDSGTGRFLAMAGAATWNKLGPDVISHYPVPAAPGSVVEGDSYYNSATHKVMIRDNVGWKSWSHTSLDNAYDYGSAITHDTGAIAITSAMVDGTDVLTISRSGAAGTGQLIQLADTQTGAHASMSITHTAGHASSGGLLIEDSTANTTALGWLLALYANDDAFPVTDGIYFKVATNNMMVDAIDASDPEITNALNVGANTIIGTTPVIDFDLFTMDADGNVAFIETNGSEAAPDFRVAGWCMLGTSSGGAMGNVDHNTYWDSAGQVFFKGTARPTHTDYIAVHELDLTTAAGDYTAPVRREAAGLYHWSVWQFTEGTSTAMWTWKIPSQMDVAAGLNIKLLWMSEDAGGDGATWAMTYCILTPNADDIPCDPTVAFDTPLVIDTTDVQYEIALTEAAIIAGATFGDGDYAVFKLLLTASRDTTACELVGVEITYRIDTL